MERSNRVEDPSPTVTIEGIPGELDVEGEELVTALTKNVKEVEEVTNVVAKDVPQHRDHFEETSEEILLRRIREEMKRLMRCNY